MIDYTERIYKSMYTYSKNNLFSKNENVTLWSISHPNYSKSEHIHDFLELVYTVSGTVEHIVDGNTYTATPNSLLFINPGQIHSISAPSDFEFINILVKQDFLSEYAVDGDTFYNLFRFFLSDPNDKLESDSQIVKFKGDDAYEIKCIINFMLNSLKEKGSGYPMVLNGYVRVIFTKLFRCLAQKNPDNTYPKSLFFNMMDSILDYIDKNYAEPITLSTLATKCYFNPSYISREFKKISGKGFKEYLIEKRITEASKFLIQTELPVEKIQLNVGFSDKTRFFKEFSKLYGCTPLEYRKNNQTTE